MREIAYTTRQALGDEKEVLKSLDNLPGYQYLNDGLPGKIHFAMIRFAQSEQTQRNFFTSHDYKKRILIYSISLMIRQRQSGGC